MSLLGIDVGTTGCKAVAFRLDGKVLSSFYREYPLLKPKEGWAELDPHYVTEAIKEVIHRVASETSKDPITALSVSCQGEAAVPVSKDGRILYNTPVSFDTRTADMLEILKSRISPEEIFAISGMPPHTMHTICKTMWLKETEPEVFKEIWKLLCYEEYTFHILGARPFTDYSLAARTMVFDINSKEWSDKLLEAADLNRDIFPDICPSGTAIGSVSRKVAVEIGLPDKVTIVTGGHDQPCNALGCGIIEERKAAYGIGTVECITPAFTKKPIDSDLMMRNNFCCYPHVVPELLVTLAFNFTGGSLLKWYRDTFGGKETEKAKATGSDPYDLIISDLPEDPSPVMILPHFTVTGTPYFDSKSKGAMLGLSLDTTKKDIVKAILEGVTFELKLNVEILDKAGINIDEIRVTGGGAKSEEWVQIKADIIGKPLSTLSTSEGGCLGAAILAGAGSGEYKSIREAAENLIKVESTFLPDYRRSKIYGEKFEIYKDIYPSVKGISARLCS